MSQTLTGRIHRFEITACSGEVDPKGQSALAQASLAFAQLSSVQSAHLFLIDAPLTDEQVRAVAAELLADPISQQAATGTTPTPAGATTIEVHYKPGVMDPVAQSTQDALVEMFPELAGQHIEVRTGTRYDFAAQDSAQLDQAALADWCAKHVANPVIQDIHTDLFCPDAFEQGTPYEFKLTHVRITDLNDEELMVLSREGHLFLDINEMHAIQSYYQNLPGGGREPTDVELETLAQTWSEHCVHKTLKATVRYDGPVVQSPFGDRPGHDVDENGVLIHNLLKNTVAAATFKLKEDPRLNDWLVSVFDDNSGIVKFDETDGVCIKVETHNHPSAIEPYGGAATGIGGCIRDIMGTGLVAKPIANTNVFCVAHPENWTENSDESDSNKNFPKPLPGGVIHPRRTLEQVVGGVRDYGNRMGIPTVNGAVYFHDDFVANPLVFAGCIGLIPLDKCFGDAQPGDRIIALGGSTGRDGIHGATFSSDELTDTHADEFSHAVQIGNAITEKKCLDVLLKARDHENGPLFSAMTDCGAGGFSSAVGEMGEKVGANVTLDTAPLKYEGLSYTEIWISEAQERMVMAVPPENCEALKALCAAEDVTYCDLGEFGCFEGDDANDQANPMLVLNYHGTEVGRIAMGLMHDGCPDPTRAASWTTTPTPGSAPAPGSANTPTAGATDCEAGCDSAANKPLGDILTDLLTHPNIASKHWIIRQYDHEVQGGSVIKPLVGPLQDGPSDASVVRPKLDTFKAISLSCGMAPQISEKANATGHATNGDSYQATLNAIDEAMRNAVCVGADPKHTAILDNFCWPKCVDPQQLGSLTRASWACYDGALAYGTPFVSGKDSLSNQFTTEDGQLITIPPTLMVTAMSMIEDARNCITMDAKPTTTSSETSAGEGSEQGGSVLLIVGETTGQLGGSHAVMQGNVTPNATQSAADLTIPTVDLKQGPANAHAIADLIANGFVAAAHDCSDGGLITAAAEMAFSGNIGLNLDLTHLPTNKPLDATTAAVAETPSRYLLQITHNHLDAAIRNLQDAGVPFAQIGTFDETSTQLTCRTDRDGQLMAAELNSLKQAWLGTLDW